MAYMTRTETMVGPGRTAEYEARQAQFYELQSSQFGFVRAMLLNSLGYPGKYTSLVVWESREAYRAWAKSEARSSFFQANSTQGATTPGRPVEAYEDILEVATEGQQGAFVNLLDWNINPGTENATAFASSRKELFELQRQHGTGFVADRLYRFLGSPNRYLVNQTWATLEALQTIGAVPEIQAYNAAHPASAYTSTPLVSERYEVVQRV